MFIWLAAGFGLLAYLLYLSEKSDNADTVKLARGLQMAGGIGGIALSAFFLLTGRFIPGLVLGGAGLAMLARVRTGKAKSAPAGQAQSQTRSGRSQKGEAPQQSPKGSLGRTEAVLLLGLEEPFTPDDVRAAHRKLMLKYHPDQGGETEIAAKLNAAKALLLGE